MRDPLLFSRTTQNSSITWQWCGMSDSMEQYMEQLAAIASCALEVSVVMPCLNEADTLATCIVKAQRVLQG